MTKRTGTLALTILVAAGTTAASAQSLAQRDMIARDRTDLATYSKGVDSACMKHVRMSINYASYRAAPGGVNMLSHAPNSILENAGDAVKNICATPDGRAAVQGKITAIVGVYGPTEAYALTSGVFTYTMDYGPGNVDRPEAWLKAHL